MSLARSVVSPCVLPVRRIASWGALWGIAGLLAFAPSEAAPQSIAAPGRAPLTLNRIFAGPEFDVETIGPFRWTGPDTYVTVEAPRLAPAASIGGVDVVRYDLSEDQRTVMVPAAQVRATGVGTRDEIEDVQISSNGRFVLLFTNAQRVWRQKTRGDYWLVDTQTTRLRQLASGAPAASLMFAKFSPDSTRVAYLRDRNLYVEDVVTGVTTSLTSDGGPERLNGTFDWVHEEEFGLRDGFRWSPDGRSIAYWQFDTTGVPEFFLINNTDTPYPALVPVRFPMAGGTNSAGRVGVVPARGGRTRWLELHGDPRQHYITWLEWTTDSSHLLLQRLNRLQNENEALLADVRTGRAARLFVERDEAWLYRVEDARWLAQDDEILWLSERNGWRQAFAISRDGASARPLTPADEDAERVVGVDEQTGWIYYIASPDAPTRRGLYRARLDGQGRRERVTPDATGWHDYVISPSGRWALHTASAFGVPPTTAIVSLPDHRTVRTLTDNQVLRAGMATLASAAAEFFRLDIGDGVSLDAWIMKPPDFDPGRRYPLLIYVYGEPTAQTVTDRWSGKRYLWHRMLTEQGYLVASIDNRGTPAPRGRAWRTVVHRQIGILAPAEQAAAVRVLAQRAYVDPSRIGTWGWSSGGSMSLHAIFRYPELYTMAMAVAPLSDQRLYDTIYQERLMGLPDENASGYERGSPITYVDGLRGPLLVVHGSGDDNVHVQVSERLANALIARNKRFSMMVYPNRSHTISEGANTLRHLYDLLTTFLQQHLPADPSVTTAAGGPRP